MRLRRCTESGDLIRRVRARELTQGRDDSARGRNGEARSVCRGDGGASAVRSAAIDPDPFGPP